jgi:hypothetical protein
VTRASRSPDITAGDIVGWAWLLVSAGVSYEIGLLRCPGPCTSHRLDGRPRSPGVPNLRGVGAHLSILRPAQPLTGTVIPADAISARGRRRVSVKLRDREHWPPGRCRARDELPAGQCAKSSIGLPRLLSEQTVNNRSLHAISWPHFIRRRLRPQASSS